MNYICWIEALCSRGCVVNMDGNVGGNTHMHDTIIDIGVGAIGIYPLLAYKYSRNRILQYYTYIGSDIDIQSCVNATANIKQNNLSNEISIVHVHDSYRLQSLLYNTQCNSHKEYNLSNTTNTSNTSNMTPTSASVTVNKENKYVTSNTSSTSNIGDTSDMDGDIEDIYKYFDIPLLLRSILVRDRDSDCDPSYTNNIDNIDTNTNNTSSTDTNKNTNNTNTTNNINTNTNTGTTNTNTNVNINTPHIPRGPIRSVYIELLGTQGGCVDVDDGMNSNTNNSTSQSQYNNNATHNTHNTHNTPMTNRKSQLLLAYHELESVFISKVEKLQRNSSNNSNNSNNGIDGDLYTNHDNYTHRESVHPVLSVPSVCRKRKIGQLDNDEEDKNNECTLDITTNITTNNTTTTTTTGTANPLLPPLPLPLPLLPIYACCLTNPPFYDMNDKVNPNNHSVCTGTNSEMHTVGGEIIFVMGMYGIYSIYSIYICVCMFA